MLGCARNVRCHTASDKEKHSISKKQKPSTPIFGAAKTTTPTQKQKVLSIHMEESTA